MKSNQQIAEDIYGLLHGRMVTTTLANDDIGLITKALDLKDQEREELRVAFKKFHNQINNWYHASETCPKSYIATFSEECTCIMGTFISEADEALKKVGKL